MSSPAPEVFYATSEPDLVTMDDAALAVRRFGSGPPLLLVHGFPTHGATWRWLLPALATRFECVVVDLPGLGDSGWGAGTDFRLTAQARRLHGLLESLGIDRTGVVAHDTGATVARLLALAAPRRVAKLALINTEIPGHRPPWIGFLQHVSRLPGAAGACRMLLRSRTVQRSPMGFREFYSDTRLLDEPARLAPYVAPIVASARRADGMLRYLRGIEWEAVDGLRTRHASIQAPVLLLWGEDDHTFPAARGEAMASQFGGSARFVRIPRASLMPHEERPDVVLAHLVPFLES